MFVKKDFYSVGDINIKCYYVNNDNNSNANQLKTTPTTTTSQTVPATTLTAFPYQGSGNGNWSGQVTVNNTTYQMSGTMTIAIDKNGNLTGTITSDKTGGTVPTSFA
jgi:hypothetical protein